MYFLHIDRRVGVAQLEDDNRAQLPRSFVNELTDALVLDDFETTVLSGFGSINYDMTDKFLQLDTLGILLLGLVAFSIGTMCGLLMAKLMNVFSKNKINPLIGSAGVSAVPMAARVSNKVGLESDSNNFLLMHAMGPNVAGVIGSAIAAGIMIQFLG